MRVEVAIGKQIARLREMRHMSLTELGEAVGRRPSAGAARSRLPSWPPLPWPSTPRSRRCSWPTLSRSTCPVRASHPRTTVGSFCTRAMTRPWTGLRS